MSSGPRRFPPPRPPLPLPQDLSRKPPRTLCSSCPGSRVNGPPDTFQLLLNLFNAVNSRSGKGSGQSSFFFLFLITKLTAVRIFFFFFFFSFPGYKILWGDAL